MSGMSSSEKRERRLEEFMMRLAADLVSVKDKLNQVAEDNARDAHPLQAGGGGISHFFAQAKGDIGGTTANAFGTGSAYILQKLDDGGTLKRFQYDPEKTVNVIQSTGGSIPDLTYLELIYDGRDYSVVVADCTTTTPTKAPAPPSS